MLILGINTATVRSEIALIEAGKKRVIYEKSWIANFDEAGKILPQIKIALKKCKKLDGVFAVEGPGSFTGLRIGVTAANLLAMAAGAPVGSCGTFEYLRTRLPLERQKDTAVLLRAGSDFIAVQPPESRTGRGKAAGGAQKKHSRILINQLSAWFARHKNIKYILGDLRAEDYKKYQLPSNIKWLRNSRLLTFGQALIAILKNHSPHSGLHSTRLNIIKPYYLQPPKITLSKKPTF